MVKGYPKSTVGFAGCGAGAGLIVLSNCGAGRARAFFEDCGLFAGPRKDLCVGVVRVRVKV